MVSQLHGIATAQSPSQPVCEDVEKLSDSPRNTNDFRIHLLKGFLNIWRSAGIL